MSEERGKKAKTKEFLMKKALKEILDYDSTLAVLAVMFVLTVISLAAALSWEGMTP